MKPIDAIKYAIRFFFVIVGLFLLMLLLWTLAAGPEVVAEALFGQ